MSRSKLEKIGEEVARKNAGSLIFPGSSTVMTEEEAIKRYRALLKSNSTAQLRKYIKKHG